MLPAQFIYKTDELSPMYNPMHLRYAITGKNKGVSVAINPSNFLGSPQKGKFTK